MDARKQMFFFRLEGSKEQLREGASKRRKKGGDGANVDDSCTTDDQRKEPTYRLLQFHYINNDLRNQHLRTTCDNSALVLIDQVGL